MQKNFLFRKLFVIVYQQRALSSRFTTPISPFIRKIQLFILFAFVHQGNPGNFAKT